MSKMMYGKRWPEDYRFRFYYGDHVVNVTPVMPDLMKRIDGRALVRRLADAGVEAMYTYASNGQNWLYPTEVKPGFMHPALKGRDFFGEVADECQRLKIPFIGAYGYPNAIGPREWRHYYPVASPNNAVNVCFNTGYGEFFQKEIEEIASRYPLAGIFIDMLDHPGPVCCEGCARRFKEAVGAAPPRVKDIRSPLYQAFKLWMYQDTARFVRECRAILQAHQPDATFVQNSHVLACEDLYETADANDYIYTDPGIAFGYGAGNGGAVGLGAWMGIFRALSRGKPPFEMLLDNLSSPHGLLSVVPPEAYAAVMAMLEAQGGAGGPGSLMDQYGHWNEACVAMTKDAGSFSKKRRAWAAVGEPVRFAGLYLSQESALFYGGEQAHVGAAGKYMDEFHGAWLMLQQEHWPTDVLTRRDLKQLSEYPVIYLANAVCMSDAECAAFRKYVEEGGTLVASYRTSLSDEWHDPRQDFGLADVFGVRFKGCKIEPYGALQMPLPKGLFDTLPWENRNLSLPQAALVCEAADPANARVLLHDRYRSGDVDGLYAAHAYTREEPFGPGLVEHRLGQGRCFYFAGKIFSAYLFTGIPSLRRLATRWILPKPIMDRLPIRLKAPDSVELTAWSQPDQDRILVHLVNFQSAPGRLGLPAPEIPETEHILPVHDLELEILFSAADIQKVILQPDDLELKVESKAGRTVMHIPKIHIHHIVEIKFWHGRAPRYPDSRKEFPYARLDLRERVQRWIASRPTGYDPNDLGTYSFDTWIEPEAFLVDWRVIGPFAAAAANVPQPDQKPDFEARYTGLNGESVGWVAMNGLEQNKNGFVEMCVKIGNTRGTVGYAAALLNADQAHPAVFRVGNDDLCRIWVNGKLCWEDAGSEDRRLGPDKAEFTAELRKGANVILVRKVQIGHGMGFYLRKV